MIISYIKKPLKESGNKVCKLFYLIEAGVFKYLFSPEYKYSETIKNMYIEVINQIVDAVRIKYDEDWFDLLVKEKIISGYVLEKSWYGGKENYRYFIRDGMMNLEVRYPAGKSVRFAIAGNNFKLSPSTGLILSGFLSDEWSYVNFFPAYTDNNFSKNRDFLFYGKYSSFFRSKIERFYHVSGKNKGMGNVCFLFRSGKLVIVEKVSGLYFLALYSIKIIRVVYAAGLLVVVLFTIFLLAIYYNAFKEYLLQGRIEMAEESEHYGLGNPIDEIDREVEEIAEKDKAQEQKRVKTEIKSTKPETANIKEMLAKDGIIIKK